MRNENHKVNRRYEAAGITLLIAFVLLVSANRSSAVGQQRETFSDLFTALQAVQNHYHLLMGVETLPAATHEIPVAVDFSETDVSNILNNLIAQRPAYIWAVDDGFYDVYPRDKGGSLAQLTIGGFSLTEASPDQTSTAISNLPEVQRWLSDHQTRRAELLNGTDTRFRKAKTKVSLAIKNAALSTILNQVTQLYGNRVWRIVHEGTRDETVGIYF